MGDDIEKTTSLFQEVKQHIIENIDDKNIPILASISKATDTPFGEYDFHSVKDTLCLIHKHFTEQKHEYNRREIFETFGKRLIVENVEQLTDNFNRILENVRKIFPDFNLTHESHNHVFGSKGGIGPCSIRRCSDNEVEAYVRHLHTVEGYSEEEVLEDKQQIIEERENYSEDVNERAKDVGLPFSDFPYGLRYLFGYSVYTGREYAAINTLLRSIKTSDMTLGQMVESFNSFAQNLALPFYSQEDFSIYRGDTLSFSSDSLTTRGFYSGGLSVLEIGHFAKNGGRIVKINITKGTPFIPIILKRIDEGEIVLLPGTVLRKDTETKLPNGHYAEYSVIESPPKLSEMEEATLFKHAIPTRFEDAVNDIKMFKRKIGKKWAKGLEKTRGAASLEETIPFVVNFINSKYNGDW